MGCVQVKTKSLVSLNTVHCTTAENLNQTETKTIMLDVKSRKETLLCCFFPISKNRVTHTNEIDTNLKTILLRYRKSFRIN